MRARINIDTMSDIQKFVEICSLLNYKINLIDGHQYCVSAKSLMGAIATADWSEVYVECDHDIRSHIWQFLAE